MAAAGNPVRTNDEQPNEIARDVHWCSFRAAVATPLRGSTFLHFLFKFHGHIILVRDMPGLPGWMKARETCWITAEAGAQARLG